MTDASKMTFRVIGLDNLLRFGVLEVVGEAAFLNRMRELGHAPAGTTPTSNTPLRVEIQGRPRFENLAGPFWDNGGVRYETWAVYHQLSM